MKPDEKQHFGFEEISSYLWNCFALTFVLLFKKKKKGSVLTGMLWKVGI